MVTIVCTIPRYKYLKSSITTHNIAPPVDFDQSTPDQRSTLWIDPRFRHFDAMFDHLDLDDHNYSSYDIKIYYQTHHEYQFLVVFRKTWEKWGIVLIG